MPRPWPSVCPGSSTWKNPADAKLLFELGLSPDRLSDALGEEM